MPRGGAKPGERRGGRKAGTPNKFTADLKTMILGALDGAGGQTYLQRQAETNPVAFMTLVGKVLPLQVTGDRDAPLVVHTVSYANAEPDPPA
jgi:hypothetical protein